MTCRDAIALLALLASSGCTLLFDPDAGYPCDGAGQCAPGYRCIDSTCTESGPACGDYVTDPGEQCDDGRFNTNACPYGQVASCTVCSLACEVVAGVITFCGDGTIDAGNGEGCEDGNAVTESCDYGELACTVCDASCHPAAGATSFCGDGVTDGVSGEACDLGTGQVAACPAWILTPPPEGFCGETCQPLSCPGVRFCGDGTPDTSDGETCDLAAANGECGRACGRDCSAWSCDREWVWWTPAGESLADGVYDTSAPGVVVDSVTKLMWQRDEYPWDVTWLQASIQCTNDLTLGGYTDWRLPTLAELLSIADYARANPAINPNVFPGTTPGLFWTSTAFYASSGSAWAVNFYLGHSYDLSKGYGGRVRCVR